MATSEQNARQTSLEYIPLGETIDKDGNKVDLLVVAELRKRDNFRMQRSGGQKGRSLRPSPTELKGLYRNGKIDFVEGGEEKFRSVMSELNVDLDKDGPTSYRRATRKKATAGASGTVDVDSPLSSLTVPKLRDLLRSLGGSPYAGSKPKTKPVLIKEIQELQGRTSATDDKVTQQEPEAEPETKATPTVQSDTSKELSIEESATEESVTEEPVTDIEVEVPANNLRDIPSVTIPAMDERETVEPISDDKTLTGISYDNAPKIKFGEPDFGIEGIGDFDDETSEDGHGPDIDFDINNLIGEPTVSDTVAEDTYLVEVPDQDDKETSDVNPVADDVWGVPNIGFDFGDHGLLFNTGEHDDDDSAPMSDEFAEQTHMTDGQSLTDNPIIEFTDDDIASDLVFDIDESDESERIDDDAISDILTMDLDDEGGNGPHVEDDQNLIANPVTEEDVDEAIDNFTGAQQDTPAEQDEDTDSFMFSGIPLTIPTKARPNKRAKVARRHKEGSLQDTSSIANRIIFAQPDTQEDLQQIPDSDAPVTSSADTKLAEAPSGILFAPGVGVDYGNNDFDLDEPVEVVDDFDLDEPADIAEDFVSYGSDDLGDFDLDEPVEISDDFKLDEPIDTFDLDEPLEASDISSAVDEELNQFMISDIQETADSSDNNNLDSADSDMDEPIEIHNDDRVLLQDDEEDLIDIFDDLDQEGIKTSESLMEEVYPSYPEASGIGSEHANYSGFQFAWSDSSEDVSADDISDKFVVTPAVESNYAHSGAASTVGLAEDAYYGVQDGYGNTLLEDEAQGEHPQVAMTDDMFEQSDETQASSLTEDKLDTMTSDGYPLSHGTNRGINEGDRNLVRKTFKRMLLVVLIVALIAVASIVILSMNGIQIFPMLSF